MAYKKQLLKPRICHHCGDPYQAVDRRRMYCRPSCKTLASNACRTRANAGLPLKSPLTAALAGPTPEASAGTTSLPFDLQTVGVVAAASALGTYSVRALDKLFSAPTPAPSGPGPALPAVLIAPAPIDPASWFPAAVLAAPASSVLLEHHQWRQAQVCLQLDYFGRRFYYQPARR
jgi:hypothetical protein